MISTIILLEFFHILFSYNCQNVYEKLDKINDDILVFENELEVLTDTANIYEQQVQEFKQIKLARRELRMLKCLWDYIVIIDTSLDEWKTTVWKKIDVEGMDQECKKLTRELRRELFLSPKKSFFLIFIIYLDHKLKKKYYLYYFPSSGQGNESVGFVRVHRGSSEKHDVFVASCIRTSKSCHSRQTLAAAYG